MKQTFEKQSAMLVLTFSDGSVVETTGEHPFYVEHKGYIPACLLTLRDCIVTRAGPSLGIASIEKKKEQTTVYNFEVEDFHTYFVGSSGLWVHNAKYGLPANRTNLHLEHQSSWLPPHPKAPNQATDFDRIDQVGDDIWLIETKILSGSAESAARDVRRSMSNYRDALDAHFAGQLSGFPSDVGITGSSLGSSNVKFGIELSHPNSIDPVFQSEVLRQLAEWEKRSGIDIVIDFK